MIIVPDENSKSASKSALEGSSASVTPTDSDPPPSYSPVVVASGSTISQTLIVPPDVKPSNFTRLVRNNGSVKGTWVVDPALIIPASFLTPLGPNETEDSRKNLALESKNGSVDADVFVMPVDVDSTKKKRVSIHTSSLNGSVTTRVHDVSPTPPSTITRPSLAITSHAMNGSVNIYLPRSFCGPLRLKTHSGSVKFSDAVRATMTPFSEMGGLQRCFIGHFDAAEFQSGEEWAGDELDAESMCGAVKIYFDDEGWAPGKPRPMGFFERLFNF